MVYAIVMSIMFTKGNYNPEKFDESYKKLSLWKKIARILVLIIFLGGIFLLISLIPYGTSISLRFFLYWLKVLIVGICLIVAIPILYYIMKLDINGDFLRYQGSFVEYKEELIQKNNRQVSLMNFEAANNNNSNKKPG